MNGTEKLDGEAGGEQRRARDYLQQRIYFDQVKTGNAALGRQRP